MAKSSLNRREFLKASAYGASALALSSCSSVDRFFMGDKRDLRNEVVILGGGAAGLVAAYELKKRKIPFRLFEASSRLGGRVQSVNVFPAGGPVAELGAEFFDNTHTHVLALAKELNLPVREIKSASGVEAHLFSFSGKTYRVKDLAEKMKTLHGPLRRVRTDLFRDQDVVISFKNALQYERSVYYDSMSLKDLLESWKSEVDPTILKLVEAQAVNRFGVDAKDQSALHFISTIDAEGSSLLSGRSTYRMDLGLSEMTQTLAGRVSGVIPDQIVKLNSPLLEISEKRGEFRLTFASGSGEETYTTRNIICTLPFSKLREVKGIGDLAFTPLKHEVIKSQAYATHSKGVLPFTTNFWKTRQGTTGGNLGNFTGDFMSQKIWDSSREQDGLQGLLSFQRAGAAGANAGASAQQEALKDLQLFYSSVPAMLPDSPGVLNWSQKPWSLGSMAVYKPGQYARYNGVAGEPEYDGRFHFAGEHTSLRSAGTLQGALESGIRAASTINV